MVPFETKLINACSNTNAYLKYKKRNIFSDDGRKYIQMGLKKLEKNEQIVINVPRLGSKRKEKKTGRFGFGWGVCGFLES